jgi:LysM repeat protein
MKKPLLFSLILLLLFFTSGAQTSNLLVKRSDKDLYIEHKVVAKENFYSVSRIYNAHPRSIASFNKLDMTKGLIIGQVLRIPLTDSNFTQQGNHGTPVYYKLEENEGLLKVSAAFKGVPLENLRNWNGLSDEKPAPGSKLIVGFLVSSQLPATTINRKKDVKIGEEKTERLPIVIRQEEKQDDSDIKEAVVKKTVIKEETTIKVIPNVERKAFENPGEGYFKILFDQQIKKIPITKAETVTSGVFKTTSGWQDEKYYLLMDIVQPGTIVKIINPGNNKAVYAKVLGEMSGIRQNEGLNIRISNAAASALQVTEQDKFVVKVSY